MSEKLYEPESRWVRHSIYRTSRCPFVKANRSSQRSCRTGIAVATKLPHTFFKGAQCNMYLHETFANGDHRQTILPLGAHVEKGQNTVQRTPLRRKEARSLFGHECCPRKTSVVVIRKPHLLIVICKEGAIYVDKVTINRLHRFSVNLQFRLLNNRCPQTICILPCCSRVIIGDLSRL